MKTYRIMSFDGGGVRGMFTSQLLSMLSHEVDFLKNIDLFAGTSTGSFIALGLCAQLTPEQLVNFYEQFAQAIFIPNEGYDKLTLEKPKYTNQFLKSLMLQHVFPTNPTLADLPKNVVIPAFKLKGEKGSGAKSWGPMYFHNFDRNKAKCLHLVDVALASGAAPLYFPSYQGSIDGGVFANNPSMVSLCLALEKSEKKPEIYNIRLFSLGTGLLPDYIEGDVEWGAKKWLASKGHGNTFPEYPLYSLMTEGTVDAADYQCSVLLKKHYQRLDGSLNRSVALDSWQDMEYLKQRALALPKEHPALWKSTIDWLKEYFCKK